MFIDEPTLPSTRRSHANDSTPNKGVDETAPATIDTFEVGDRFMLKSHKGCVYEVTGFHRLAFRWMDVRDLNGTLPSSTSFSDVNLDNFAERREIERVAAPDHRATSWGGVMPLED
jgi:hypothetical protein